MASTDVDKVLPNTEAMRDAIDLLNAMDDAQFATLAADVLSGAASGSSSNTSTAAATSSNKQLIAQEAAIRFIVYQLTYFTISKPAQAAEALGEEVVSASSSEPVRLSEGRAEALAELWAENGKAIVQSARAGLIRKVCNGTNATSIALSSGASPSAAAATALQSSSLSSSSALREPHISVSTSIAMGSGAVLEVAPDTAEGAVKVSRAAQTMDFTPQAVLTLPGGATVAMDEAQAYDLFSELDAIQRQMDSLFASA